MSAGPSAATAIRRMDLCRVCGSDGLAPVLDLGRQALGNAFHRPGGPEPLRAPLELVRCTACSLVQLGYSVDPGRMYATYWYRSGVNRTMTEHLHGIVAETQRVAGVVADDVVVDIGCNDGTLLQAWPAGVRTVGVDPSNLRPARADAFVNDYFSARSVAGALGGARAKAVTSIAMFYDLDRPAEFARDVAAILDPRGVWVLELSYLPRMLEMVSYDTICHEHVAYYRLGTFERVLADSGLEVVDLGFNASNGGSFRIVVAHRGARTPAPIVARVRAVETLDGMDGAEPYARFAEAARRNREELLRFLRAARAHRRVVYGYGASTKGMVTLQFCGIDAELLPAIAERNPDKVGLLTPGTDIPIVSEAEMRRAQPDALLVLPWHFLDEFLLREREYLARGGRLVTPMPTLRLHRGERDVAGTSRSR